jgi:hypothetical protein
MRTLLATCHRSVQNQPVVIESKPATFMVSKGFEVGWQVGSHFGGEFLRVIDESEARASSDQMQNTVTLVCAEHCPDQGQNGINGGKPVGRYRLCRIWT